MTIANKLALLEQTKEAQRVKLGLPKSLPFSRYHEFFQFKFVPSYLFLNGEQGVWFDPSDLKTMFQDVNGLISVTKDGDPVALIKDKSGNGNHATQPTASSRPIYRTDGILHWLEFDGIDDFIATADGAIGLLGSYTVGMVHKVRSKSVKGVTNGSKSPQKFSIYQSGEYVYLNEANPLHLNFVLQSWGKISSAKFLVDSGAVKILSYGVDKGVFPYSGSGVLDMIVGADYKSGSGASQTNLYQLIVRSGLTQDKEFDAYLATKAGIKL